MRALAENTTLTVLPKATDVPGGGFLIDHRTVGLGGEAPILLPDREKRISEPGVHRLLSDSQKIGHQHLVDRLQLGDDRAADRGQPAGDRRLRGDTVGAGFVRRALELQNKADILHCLVGLCRCSNGSHQARAPDLLGPVAAWTLRARPKSNCHW